MTKAMASAVHGDVSGTFKYLEAGAETSLYANGKVLTYRDRDGNSSGTRGVALEERTMTIKDARPASASGSCTLHSQGFELQDAPLTNPAIDFLDHEQVVGSYYDECVALVKDATGAAHVYAFDHNVRSASGKSAQQRIAGGQHVQGPAQVVHGDYTLTSAPKRLRDLGRVPALNDTYRSRLSAGDTLIEPAAVERALAPGARFAIINVWRNIAHEPVATHPLALCDAQSVVPEDLVVYEIHYADRVGENYFAKQAERHRWFYYPGMTRNEALLIKQWDSSGPMARSDGTRSDATDTAAPSTFSFHSSFSNPETPMDAPERWSLEVRCMALYEN
jgi:hypothetical protein